MTMFARLYGEMEPYQQDDDGSLSTLLTAYAAPFELLDSIARDSDAGAGWTAVLDADRAPPEALAWLAQFVGVTLIRGDSDAHSRIRIKSTDGWKRGTPAAMIGAVQQLLTGTKRVVLDERYGGDPAALLVATYAIETPGTGSTVQAALMAQKPAGILLTYQLRTSVAWEDVKNTYATWQDVKNAYATWGDLAVQPI